MVTECLYRWCGGGANTLPYEFQQLICFKKKKKRITVFTSQGATTHSSSFIFNTVLYIFMKWLLHKFYSAARNSKIIFPCNFTLTHSQNAEKNIGKFTFETTLIWCRSSSCRMCIMPHGRPLVSSGLEYMWIILLHSNTNDFHNGFHRVDCKVACAVS